MKKRLIAALIFAFTMIYLTISVSAAGTFDSQSYYIAFRSNTSSGSWKSATAGNFPYTLTSANSTINSFVFLGYKTNQIIADDSIIVATIKVDNIEGITLLGAGQPTSATLFTQTGITYAEMMEIPLTQEIIASTSIQLGDGIQHTVTFKAKGYTSQNAVIGYRLGAIATSGSAITLVNCDLYESIQEAASSGTTPEEMRDVLSSWGEEELLPGIQDSVQSGVASGMEEALQNEKQEASSEGGALIDQIHGGLSGTFGQIEEAEHSLTSLANALKHNGQTAILSIPPITLPFIGTISEGLNWNMTSYIQQAFPSGFILLIRCIFSLGVVLYPILEITRQIQKLLDKGGS